MEPQFKLTFKEVPENQRDYLEIGAEKLVITVPLPELEDEPLLARMVKEGLLPKAITSAVEVYDYGKYFTVVIKHTKEVLYQILVDEILD